MTVSQQRLKELLEYDASTGAFTRKASRRGHREGERAGCLSLSGYVDIGIDRVKYRAHRLAYLYVTGEWPPQEIDHINGDPADNRFCNLRPASHSENGCNKGLQANSTSGRKGVHWHKPSQKWQASCRVNNKKHYLGLFDDVEEASSAYETFASKAHGDFRRMLTPSNVRADA